MRPNHLIPLPATLAAWIAAGHPHVFSEVREGLGCWIVGTIEVVWNGPATPDPVTRVRAVIACAPFAADLHGLELSGRFVIHPPDARLVAAIERVERARERSLRACVGCSEITAPEHGSRMEDGFTCHGCMTGDHGVIF